ncbi:MAG: hypothetical protein C0436_04850 [Alphaproteobacteria bacterium]|nr:hypothetical protein [Alphaproteobacteria bacterium]
MSTVHTDGTNSTTSQTAAALRSDELNFSQASLSSVGADRNNPRSADIMNAVEQIMSVKGIATQALGFGATVGAACALISGGVPATIAGPALMAGAAASLLNPSKGNGRS